MTNKEVLDEVAQVVEWYNQTPESFKDCNTLIHKRKVLATMSFHLAPITALADKYYLQCQNETKRIKAQVKHQAKGTGVQKEAAMRMNEAVLEAEREEGEALYQKVSSRRHWEALKEVLSAMNSHIGRLKQTPDL